jgi:hypothetical protein
MRSMPARSRRSLRNSAFTVPLAAFPKAGAYVYRPVKDTEWLSMHAYGAAIALNLKSSNYWLWKLKGTENIPYRNAMPRDVADVF